MNEKILDIEQEIRSENLDFNEQLLKVVEKYPELAPDIRRSLAVPQLGEHHNEGPTMEAHLQLMVKNLEAISKGEFPAEIPEQTRETLLTITTIPGTSGNPDSINPELIEYIFLHDIAKAECLRLKLKHGESVDITWEEWQEIAVKGTPYRFQKSGEEEKAVASISYFHTGEEGQLGNHGFRGADNIRKSVSNPDLIPPLTLLAIEQHEIAYQFEKINAATYQKYFANLSVTEQDWVVTASYMDSASSLLPNGKPGIKNFINLVHSRYNYDALISRFQSYSPQLQKSMQNQFSKLLKADHILSPEEIEALNPAGGAVNKERVMEVLIEAIAKGTIPNSYIPQDIIDILMSEGRGGVAKTYPEVIRIISPELPKN